MNRLIHKILPLLLALYRTCTGSEAVESFFEFNEVPAASTSLLEAIDGKAVAVLQGLTVEDGYYQINEQTVSHVAAGALVSLPDLPQTFNVAAAALMSERLYAVGDNSLLKLDIGDCINWSECATLPVNAGTHPVLVNQQGTLFLTGVGNAGMDAYAYNPSRNEWSPRAAAPQDLRGYVATACGNDHILYFNGQIADDTILAYHRTTDTWFTMGQLPGAIQVLAVGSKGTEFTLFSAESTVTGEALLRPTNYGWADHLVVAVLVCLLVGVGVYFSNKEKTSGDYFRGGQRVPWWAAGLSMGATHTSVTNNTKTSVTLSG
tara:strand:- start:1187 stop:2143 length:957 start_codon:yes stop_codon:yes gene_type:complete